MINFSDILKAFNLAKIGGKSALITPTITTSAAAYSSGDCVGGFLQIKNSVTSNNGTAILKSILIKDSANQKSPLTILLFNSLPTGATTIDNSAFAYGSSSFPLEIAKINVLSTDYETIDSKATADIDTLGKVLQSYLGEDLYVIVITTGTPTYGSGSNILSITFGFLQD